MIEIGILAVIALVQQWHIHKLINKLMSRNYYDYEITQKSVNLKDKSVKPEIHLEQDETGYLG